MHKKIIHDGCLISVAGYYQCYNCEYQQLIERGLLAQNHGLIVELSKCT